MSADTVIGEQFFRQLALPWVPDLLADQNLGGGIAWASGEIPLLVVLIALLVQWSRTDQRDATRRDRHAVRRRRARGVERHAHRPRPRPLSARRDPPGTDGTRGATGTTGAARVGADTTDSRGTPGWPRAPSAPHR